MLVAALLLFIQVGFELGLNATPPSGFRGSWQAVGVMVPAPYAFATDTTLGSPGGVVTNNDLGLVWLYPKNGIQVGDVGGWNSYGFNGYSFARPVTDFGFPTAPASTLLSAFGYPCQFDRCYVPQISHSATYNAVFSTIPSGGKPPPPNSPISSGFLKNMIR